MSKTNHAKRSHNANQPIVRARKFDQCQAFHIRFPVKGTMVRTGHPTPDAITEDDIVEVLLTHRGIFAVTKDGDKVELGANADFDFIYNGDWGGY